MHWQKISIIGIGLLGGSIGLAIRTRRLAARTVGYVRRIASIEECAGTVVHEATTDLHQAVAGADLVVLCTPVGQMETLVEKMLPALKKGAVLTDVGSVKGAVVAGVESLCAKSGVYFVGSHPMAGGEKTGVKAARADLFEEAVCVITPTARTHPDALTSITGFWSALGGRPVCMSPEMHDEFVSRSSHLPHVVAAELANYVLSPVHPREQKLLCASGFRDTTRLASGSAEMWRDIALANRRNLARVLAVFIEDLEEFRLALERQDERAVMEFFVQAQTRRDQWCQQYSDFIASAGSGSARAGGRE